MQLTILKQLPTSLQILDTLKNLQKLSPLNLSSKEFKSTLQSYAQQQLIVYKSQQQQGGSQQQNISNHYSCYLNEQCSGEYYINQLTNEQVKVQPLDGTIVQRKPIENQQHKLSQANQKLLSQLHQKLSTYIDMHYVKPSSFTCHFTINNAQQNKIEQITIGITSKLNNIDNFYSGETISVWRFTKTKYTGVIKAANHFYQNGNIMFSRQRPLQKEYSGNDAVKLDSFDEGQIDNILRVIKKEEKTYQKQLQTLFTKKCSQALKKIRRVTPLTQNKMIWNLNAVRMNQEINLQLPKMTL